MWLTASHDLTLSLCTVCEVLSMFVSVHCESLQDVSTLMPRLILCQTRPLSFFGFFGFITIAQYDEAAKSQGHQVNISRFTLNFNFPWHLLGESVLHTVMGFMLTKLDLETKWTFLLPEGKQFALTFFFYQSKIKVNKMPHPSHRFLFISPFFLLMSLASFLSSIK